MPRIFWLTRPPSFSYLSKQQRKPLTSQLLLALIASQFWKKSPPLHSLGFLHFQRILHRLLHLHTTTALLQNLWLTISPGNSVRMAMFMGVLTISIFICTEDWGEAKIRTVKSSKNITPLGLCCSLSLLWSERKSCGSQILTYCLLWLTWSCLHLLFKKVIWFLKWHNFLLFSNN